MKKDKINNPHFPSKEILDASVHLARDRIGQSLALINDLNANIDMILRNVVKHAEGKGMQQMGDFAMIQVDHMLHEKSRQAHINQLFRRITELTQSVKDQQEVIIVLEGQVHARNEPEEENIVTELRGKIALREQQLSEILRRTKDPRWLASKFWQRC